MILLLELALFTFGIVVLALGKLQFSPNKVVEGLPARLLGIVAMIPMPLAFVIGFIIGFREGLRGGDPQQFAQKFGPMLAVVELALVVGAAVIVAVTGLLIAGPSHEERIRRRRRRREREADDDDDYEPRPRRRRARDFDDDD